MSEDGDESRNGRMVLGTRLEDLPKRSVSRDSGVIPQDIE